ncbi:hypothetical protein TTHERM_00317110 (macronuclear) [Tetrahymena thermophila SB210]|uniref:Uncharacterized protein n=1 Tax=Tetrahymena thermophila (strain SB210) TaxID=312017 RepID=I7LW84_TETTS|nr:hypothetical protein TTHERM_00317110 [Tetrahymena thermophila SB210]EAS01147.2 hypothetical protein TTHERM_00317110 [Tetrahymena thermophila SB210]|eukprot:XP_001021392.2 hypothetical protein TTHERM_00317110 [Tetrahymena thermophila SB210]
MSQFNQKKDYNLPFQSSGSLNNLNKFSFTPQQAASHQNTGNNYQKLQKMNSCYFEENSEKENKPHLASSATANYQEFKKGYSRIPCQVQAIDCNQSQIKFNQQSQNKIESPASYYLPPQSSIIVGSDSKESHKRYIDFSQNSMQVNNPCSSTTNSSQTNNISLKQNNQNDSLQQNQAETVNVKQYLISKQNSFKKDNSQGSLFIQKEPSFQSIKRNILGDILNNQNISHEITSKKITSSVLTTPKNENLTPKNSNNFRCDQFNESLNRIQKLKDKYSYIDKKFTQKDYETILEDQQKRTAEQASIKQQNEGLLFKYQNCQMGGMLNNLVTPLESKSNFQTSSHTISRASFLDQEQNCNKKLERVNSVKHYSDNQSNNSFLQKQEAPLSSRGQSPFSIRQNDQQGFGDQYRSQVQKYKQYFIESAIESERLNREQENLKDENEKLRFRLKELLRISQIQTGNLQERHNNLTPTSIKYKNSKFQEDCSQDQIASNNSLQNQQQNQNIEKKRGKSNYIESENINMKKELEECVLLLESGRQKIDSLKVSIHEKEQLIKQSKNYTTSLEKKIQELEKENCEIKSQMEAMKRQKCQNSNLIEQISQDGYQEHLKEQIIKCFDYKFVNFLENQKKQMLDLTQQSQQNLEEIGVTVFQLTQNIQNAFQRKNNINTSYFYENILKYAQDELQNIKKQFMNKLNLSYDMIDIKFDKNFENFLNEILSKDLSQESLKKSILCPKCLKSDSEVDCKSTQNQDLLQQYLIKNTGRDSLNNSQASFKFSETKENKNNKQIVNCIVNNNQINQKTQSLLLEQDLLQMLLIQAQSLEHVINQQQ